jgi:hypothetical protein
MIQTCEEKRIEIHECEERRLFFRMSKWIDLPPDSRNTALTKCIIKSSKTPRHLVYDLVIISGRLVIHTPTATYEFKLTCGLHKQF